MPDASAIETSAALLTAVERLHVWASGERRAPHKPLLLLLALGRLLRGERRFRLDQVEAPLGALLLEYAPPVQRVQPALPFWHLQRDGLWEVDGADGLPRTKGGFPRLMDLRATRAGLPGPIADILVADRALLRQVVQVLLDGHFPVSLHDDLRKATGLDGIFDAEPAWVAEGRPAPRPRDPAFRRDVLRAYEHRCAATGFRAALDQSYFGVEAAHVHWHAQGGPDEVANGLALEPLMHLLFDRGAWSLTDDRRILVSARFTGSDEAVRRLRSLHGQPLRAPITGAPVSLAHIRWHREPAQGGVFRQPPLSRL